MSPWKVKTEKESIEKETLLYRNMTVCEKWDCFRDIMSYLESVRRSTGVEFYNDDEKLGELWVESIRVMRSLEEDNQYNAG